MIEQLHDYITKFYMPGSQGKHYGDNNKCIDGCLALVEHVTNGMILRLSGRNAQSLAKDKKFCYDDQIIPWLGISI